MIERHRIPLSREDAGAVVLRWIGTRDPRDAAGGVPRRAGRSAPCSSRRREIARNDRFRIETNGGVFAAPAVVIATGGLSIPKIGATGFAYDIARRFGLAVVEPRPGLAGLKVAGETLALCNALSGVSVDAIVSSGSVSFRENILLTHRGLSGPRDPANFLILEKAATRSPSISPQRSMRKVFCAIAGAPRPRAELKTVLAEILPSRLAEAIAPEQRADGQSSRPPPGRDVGAVKRWKVRPSLPRDGRRRR